MHITILDGGIGHLLKERNTRTSVANDKELASSFLVAAFANVDAPDAVRQVHQDYVDAGADIMTVNNFPITRWSLARAHRDAELTELTQVRTLCIACMCLRRPRPTNQAQALAVHACLPVPP